MLHLFKDKDFILEVLDIQTMERNIHKGTDSAAELWSAKLTCMCFCTGDTDLWWFKLKYNVFGNSEAAYNREGWKVEFDQDVLEFYIIT